MPNNKNDTALKGNNNIYSGVSPYNSLNLVMDNFKNEISTAIPVKVVGVESGGANSVVGYVDVLPLVTLVSGDNKAVEPVNLYHLPYFRLQGGKVAIITDPIVGDKGLAIFAQSDCSTVTSEINEPQQPGSSRKHSQSDGFYIGGFLNQPPTCYLELTQDNKAILHATGGIQIDGDINVNGSIKTSGDVVAGSISLQGHIHGNVQGGNGTTGRPQ